jgi:hypothetical protein
MAITFNVMYSTMRDGVKATAQAELAATRTTLPNKFEPAQTTVGEVMEYFSRNIPKEYWYYYMGVHTYKLSIDENGYYMPQKYLSFSEICPWDRWSGRWRKQRDLLGREIVGKFFNFEIDDDLEMEQGCKTPDIVDSDLKEIHRNVIRFPNICFNWSYITKDNIIGESPITFDTLPYNLLPRDDENAAVDLTVAFLPKKRMTIWVDVVQIEQDYQQMHSSNRAALKGRWASHIDLESQRDGRKDSLSSYLRDDNAIGLMSKVRSHRGVPKVWRNEGEWRQENIGYHPIPTLGERIYERDAPEDKFLTRTWSIGGRKKYRKKRTKSKRSKSKRSKSKRSKSKKKR